MKAPVRKMHFAGDDGVPICRRLWVAHTKNKPEVSKHRECVTCAACLRRTAPRASDAPWFSLSKTTRLYVLGQLAERARACPKRSEQHTAWQRIIDLAMSDEGNSDDVKERLNLEDVVRYKLADVIDTDDWEPRS